MRSEPNFTVRDEDDAPDLIEQGSVYIDPLDHPEETHDS